MPFFMIKLKNVKVDLRKWGNNKFGKCEEEIKNHKKEANKWELEAENRCLNENERNLWKDAKRECVQKENWRSQMLQQKARVNWVAEGDENSSFFHASVRRKGGKNRLKGLMIDGEWCDEPGKIKKEAFDF